MRHRTFSIQRAWLMAGACLGSACSPPRHEEAAVRPDPENEAPSVRRSDPGEGAPSVLRPDPELIAVLDRMIQKRFARVTDEDVATNRLGASRLMAPRSRPLRVLRPERDEERQIIGRISKSGWEAAVYVVQAGEEGGLPGRIVGPIAPEGVTWTWLGDRRAIGDLASRSIAENRPVSGSAREIPLEARAVVASDPVCLTCHAGKRLGEPLGAVVYGFRRDRPRVPTPGHPSGG